MRRRLGRSLVLVVMDGLLAVGTRGAPTQRTMVLVFGLLRIMKGVQTENA